MTKTIFLLLSSVFLFASLHAETDLPDYSPARLVLGYSGGKFIGVERGYGEAGLFFPALLNDRYAFLLDVKGYRFEDEKWGASAGCGVRVHLASGRVLGLNVFYDYLDSHTRHGFDRVGFGAEWLGCSWDARINVYCALNDKTQHSRKVRYHDYAGPYFANCEQAETPVSQGFDAEVGVPLGCWCRLNFYAAVGPYFYAQRHQPSFWGGQGRFEVNWNSLLCLQVRTSYDRVYHSHTQGQIQLRIPLGCGGCECVDALFMQPVQRNGIIFTKECCNYHWNWR